LSLTLILLRFQYTHFSVHKPHPHKIIISLPQPRNIDIFSPSSPKAVRHKSLSVAERLASRCFPQKLSPMILFLPSLEIWGLLLGKYILFNNTTHPDAYPTFIQESAIRKTKRSYCISQAKHLDSEAAKVWGYIPKES
jgi:hypothetical protein